MTARPDIAYTVSKLCEANKGPSEAHKTIMKHLWRYLKGTQNLALPLGGRCDGNNLHLRAYSDASFADDLTSRASTGGHIVYLGDGPVHWRTKKQTIVASSSTKAEFMNLTPTGMSLLWINNLLQELNLPQNRPHLIMTDSQNARLNVLNP